MAEVIGLISSILSISQVVADGMGIIIELYKAPVEIDTLQKQVQSFRQVIQAVEATTQSSTPNLLYDTLSKARQTVEELRTLITVKLIKQRDGSDHARRWAWLKHKSKIASLCDQLKHNQETLSIALGTELRTELLVSTRQLQSTLTVISQQTASTQSTATSIYERLRPMQNLLDTPESGVEPLAIPSTLRFLKTRPPFKGTDNSLERPWDEANRLISASSLNDTAAKKTEIPAELREKQASEIGLLQRAPPASSLELSSSFRPEAYTVFDAVPTLFCHNLIEVHATNYILVNHCAFFYSPMPGSWKRLTLSLTTSVESQSINLRRVNSEPHIMQNPSSCLVSTRDIAALESFLRLYTNLQDDTHLSAYLGCSSSLEKITFITPSFHAGTYLQEVTRMVNHWKCPKYSERELIHRPLYRNFPTDSFMANVHSRWVFERRFGSTKIVIDRQIYIMQVLHFLNGAPGISPFVGVVLDHIGIISGFLCELPTKGDLFDVLYHAMDSGQPIGWARREKWCRQIVQGTAEMHSKGFVVGSLADMFILPVGINSDDNAVLTGTSFTAEFRYGVRQKGGLPPEYRYSASREEGSIAAVPQSDLYQLGVLLWRIASENYSLSLNFYQAAVCNTKPDMACTDLHTDPHTDPIQLPKIGEPVPEYFEKIIAACRNKNPNKRPPAWKLLEMFPPMIEVNINPEKAMVSNDTSQHSFSTSAAQSTVHDCLVRNYFVSPEECYKKYYMVVECDICERRTSEHFFHCSICQSSDFDLCPQCFSQGRRCLDPKHFLREISVGIT